MINAFEVNELVNNKFKPILEREATFWQNETLEAISAGLTYVEKIYFSIRDTEGKELTEDELHLFISYCVEYLQSLGYHAQAYTRYIFGTIYCLKWSWRIKPL